MLQLWFNLLISGSIFHYSKYGGTLETLFPLVIYLLFDYVIEGR